MQAQKGHVYELDHVTQLITSLLDRVKVHKHNAVSNVKTVLLIDDLDRLDPEHVFRLFNIFSAHYEDSTESNKFGFDKVIFVCDIKNIREMFNHRYGLNVEFTGYIDKFYSTEVFKFDLKRYLKDSLDKIINESDYKPYKYFPPDSIDDSLVNRYSLSPRQPFNNTFKRILKDMVDLEIVRIRNLKKFKSFTLPNNRFETKYGNSSAVFFPLIVMMANIERLFTHQLDLESALERLYKNYTSNYNSVSPQNSDQHDDLAFNIIHYALPFLLDENVVFGANDNLDKQVIQKFNNEFSEPIFVVYKVSYDYDFKFSFPKLIKITTDQTTINNVSDSPKLVRPNPYWYLLQAYKNFKSRNYF